MTSLQVEEQSVCHCLKRWGLALCQPMLGTNIPFVEGRCPGIKPHPLSTRPWWSVLLSFWNIILLWKRLFGSAIFSLPKLPDREERLKLIEQESYQKAKPPEWENIDAEGPELHHQWLKMMGLRGVSYEELFITHCANHANFIEPIYFIVEENGPVPYSIDKTSHICSACLDFFNIIGTPFRKKIVVPCPGAVLFAGMAANRYYEVLRS